MNITGSSGRTNGLYNYKGLYRLGFQNLAVGRFNGVAALGVLRKATSKKKRPQKRRPP